MPNWGSSPATVTWATAPSPSSGEDDSMQIDLTHRPSRDAAIDSQGYWDGLAAGEFCVQRCAGCGLLRHYPRPMCSACHSMECEWVAVSGRGTLRSWTVCHHAFLPAFQEA